MAEAELPIWIKLGGAFMAGAASLFSSGVAVESYKRHRDRNCTAAIFAADISSLLRAVRESKAVQQYEALAEKYAAGNDFKFPGAHFVEPGPGIVFEKQLEKVGLLPPDVAGRVVLFYGYLTGLRATFKNLVTGAFDGYAESPKMKAATIRYGTELWNRAAEIGDPLVIEMNRLARERWPRWISMPRFFSRSDTDIG